MKPEKIFIILAFLFGVVNILLVPFGTGEDEFTHLSRIWEISKFHFMTKANSPIINMPNAFTRIDWRANNKFVDPISLKVYLDEYRITIEPLKIDPATTRSSYFPSLYFPAALVMGIFARILNNFPVLMTVTLIRLINLLIFLILSFLAIKTIPFGKWVLFAVLLAPEVIIISSIVNVDFASYGISALFISWVLYISFNKEKFSQKNYLILLALIFALFTLKVNYAILIALLFIIPKELFSKIQKTTLILFTIAAFLILVIAWNVITVPDSADFPTNPSISGQIAYVFSHPILFAGTVVHSISANIGNYLKEWIAEYANHVGAIPPLTYVLFGIGLILFSIFKSEEIQPTKRQRIFLISLGVFSFLAIFVIFYLAISNVGSTVIAGIHGRYFFISGLLLFLGVSGFIRNYLPQAMKIIAITTIAISQGLYILGIFATYYVFCGSNIYTPGLCYLPKYKDFDHTNYTTHKLTQGFIVKQTFVPECNKLDEIAFYLAPESNDQGSFTFQFYDGASNKLIYSKVYVVNENDLGKQLHFPIPEITSAKGKEFYFTLQGAELNSQDLSFSSSPKDDYEAGNLTVNNSAFPGDLFFQYGCNLR